MTAVFRGVLPVLETPFTRDGGVDAAGFERVVRHVVPHRLTRMMFPGFASEFAKLQPSRASRTRSHPDDESRDELGDRRRSFPCPTTQPRSPSTEADGPSSTAPTR